MPVAVLCMVSHLCSPPTRKSAVKHAVLLWLCMCRHAASRADNAEEHFAAPEFSLIWRRSQDREAWRDAMTLLLKSIRSKDGLESVERTKAA